MLEAVEKRKLFDLHQQLLRGALQRYCSQNFGKFLLEILVVEFSFSKASRRHFGCLLRIFRNFKTTASTF